MAFRELAAQAARPLLRAVGHVTRWFDNEQTATTGLTDRVDWTRIVPFVAMHLACLGALWTGVSPVALLAALLAYLVRMFAITGFYHRYFSHRSFKTSRIGQFLFGLLGAAAVQRGPLWWAAHHRHHHAHSDQPTDTHSPVQRGFWYSHMGWFLTGKGFAPDLKLVKDLMRFPELRFLDRFDLFVPVAFAAGMYGLGALLQQQAPQLHTSGGQMLVWGFFISTVACSHATFTINSLSHVFGRQRYRTSDTSRNNWWLAIVTLGEGWHNNHHYYPNSTRQGFYWYEYDFTFYVLKVMSWLGIIWDLKPVPLAVRENPRRRLDAAA